MKKQRLTKRILIQLIGISIVCGTARSWAMDIPYPEALHSARVEISNIPNKNVKDASNRYGLVIGNGEVNGVVSAYENDWNIRVSKNDFWDGRIETAEDPAIPVVDPSTGKTVREKPGNPPSWGKKYPVAVHCGDIRIISTGVAGEFKSSLDLARAVVSGENSSAKFTARILQENVILLENVTKVELIGNPWEFMPAAKNGTTKEGYLWMCQSVYGNEDVPPMESYMVSGSREGKTAIAVVTSADSSEPLTKATQLVTTTLETSTQELIKHHESVWTDFWSQSGLTLSDKKLENYWYRMVYFMRCYARKGATAAGLKACMNGLGGWHNSYKFNYNVQQAYFSAGPINHPEMVEPLIDLLINYWPRARWFAKTAFVGCEGAFVHSDVFQPKEPDPEKCKTRNKHQFAYIPFGYTLGMQGHISFMLWEYFKYKPDIEYLRTKTYPLLRDIALFYCSFLEKRPKDEQGKILVGPSYFPEMAYWGQMNGAYDIPWVQYGLKSAMEAAQVLKTDEALVARIKAVMKDLPYYETIPDPSQDNQSVVTYYRGHGKFPDDDRHASMVAGVFPAGQVNWFSSKEEKDLFRRTINMVSKIHTHVNSVVTLNIARARLGMAQEAWEGIHEDFRLESEVDTKAPLKRHVAYPNGLFMWVGHGTYIAEQTGYARLIVELLMQSVDEVIRFFPALPEDQDAEFTRLRAQGGFLVSGKHVGKVIKDLKIQSTAGGTCHFMNPFGTGGFKVVDMKTGAPVATKSSQGIHAFETVKDGSYELKPQ